MNQISQQVNESYYDEEDEYYDSEEDAKSNGASCDINLTVNSVSKN